MFIKRKQIAAQLYTVRDYMKKPADYAASLKKVRKIGYEAVELAGAGAIDPKKLKSMLDDNGLIPISSHENSDTMVNNTQATIDVLNEVGISHVALPHPGPVELTTLAQVKAYAKKLDKAGALFAKAGITLSYHNHNIEFVRIKDKPILEYFYELTDPANLKAQIDTHWVQAGGGDTVQWIKTMKGRLPTLHMKDFGVDENRERRFEEIGYGNQWWEGIVKAAKASGCKWYIVEQDTNWEKDDPFMSLKMSFDYIAKNLCTD